MRIAENAYSALVRSLRRARGSDQARAAAQAFIGKPLRNRESGVNAVISGESFKKMLSQSAVEKSISQQAHHEAVANADTLFALATLRLTRGPHRDGDIGIIEKLHHFDAPMPFDGEILRVKLLVKEMVNKKIPNPLYTLAAVKREKPSAIELLESGDSDLEKIGSPTGRPEGFGGRFAAAVAQVKRAMQDASE